MTDQAKKHREAYNNGAGNRDNVPITTHFLDTYIANIDKSPEYREVKASSSMWDNSVISVYPEELVVGRMRYTEPVFFHMGTGVYFADWCYENYFTQENFNNEQKAEFFAKIAQVKEYCYASLFDEKFGNFNSDVDSHYNNMLNKILTANQFSIDEIKRSLYSDTASTTSFGGHMVMDYQEIINNGLSAYFDKIKDARANVTPKNYEFFDALDIILSSFQNLILRTADECERQNMLSHTSDLRYIAYNKPQTFIQGLELVWFVHICADSDTFGRFDKYLYPLFKNDIENGTLTEDYALAVLESLMIKIEERDSIQNMTIGGILENGSSAYTLLTKLVMKAVRNMMYKGPNLCLRLNDCMPEFFWDEVAENLGTGQGLPALYNDNRMIKYLADIGVPLEEARDYCLAGCSQIMVPGRTQFVNDIGAMNATKILEVAYYDGIDETLSKQQFTEQVAIPCNHKKVSKLQSFDEFLSQYRDYLRYFAKIEADINNLDTLIRRNTEGYIFRSLFTRDCISKGLGCYFGGARFNSIQLEVMGLTNAADSLAAIKLLVFDEKYIDFETLHLALKANYVGYEDLLLKIKKDVPMFGNDNPYVDEIRADITKCLFDALRVQDSIIGGHYIPGEVIFVAHEPHGNCTGATPDGRLHGEVLADSAGASQGKDLNGPTALINSVLKIPVDEIVTSVVLNIKFIKKFWGRDKNKAIMLIKSFFKQGGQQIQINVCDNEVLQKAYDNPNEYRSLIIRVGGYSAYFTSLSKTLQLEIIKRTAQV